MKTLIIVCKSPKAPEYVLGSCCRRPWDEPCLFFFIAEYVARAAWPLYVDGALFGKADFHMAILENVEEAMKFIKKNTRSMYEVRGSQRIEVPEYPERVIREAIVNAVAHRDYFSADAIQIRIFSNGNDDAWYNLYIFIIINYL